MKPLEDAQLVYDVLYGSDGDSLSLSPGSLVIAVMAGRTHTVRALLSAGCRADDPARGRRAAPELGQEGRSRQRQPRLFRGESIAFTRQFRLLLAGFG